MEENNKGLTIIIAILTLLIGGMLGFFISFKLLENKCITTENNDTNKINTENTNENTTNNSYKTFSQKLKSEISSKYNTNNMAYQDVNSQVIEKGYAVYLNQLGSLYIRYNDDALNSKYGDYKIKDNVLSFNVIDTGQGGEKALYFINEDGTVGYADVEYGVLNNNTIDTKTDLGYKNIVSIINGGFSLEYSGGHDAIFIDIDGNIFNPNFKANE